jgi:serine/threonine-protein kinase RsbT
MMAPRLHDRAAGKGRQMQRVSVVDKPEWSSLDCGFGVPRVGVRRINDRSLWTGRTTSSDLRISISSDTDIVIARQQGKALAIAMNFSLTDSAFIATTVSELARALLSHTVRGEIWLHQVYEPQRVGVIIVARDPIARDAANDCRSGGTPALALPDVFRLVDDFHIGFEAGQGTTITATKWCRRR